MGGEGYEYFESVAVDAAGSAYVFGYTSSKSFPAARALYPTFRGGLYDLFVVRLNPAESLLYDGLAFLFRGTCINSA